MTSLFARSLAAAVLSLATLAALPAEDDSDHAIAGVMTEFVKPGEPGCTVGVAQGGALTHALAFGLADLEKDTPLDPHSIINLASVSKQFTAFALLLLEQDGKLKLDDPIVKYLPELAKSAHGVTLRHLLHHTGGLRDYIEMLYMKGRGDADGSTIDEAFRSLARQTAPNAAPGVEYEYSNTGFFLLGVVIARISGESLAEFSRKRIFEPLGMRNTSIVDSYPAAIPALARGYARSGSGFRIDETGWEQVGDGQVHSDLYDLALWDENFYTAKLGGRALIDRMQEVGKLNSGKPIDYAAGLSIDDWRGLRWVRHGGSWVGYRSNISRVPSEHLSVIVLCNRADANTGSLATQVAEIFLKDKLGPPEPDEDEEEAEPTPVAAEWQPGELSRFAGAYFSDEADARCLLDERGGQLYLETCAAGERLAPGKPGEFVTDGGGLILKFPAGGQDAASFIYWTSGLRGLPFHRVKESSE
jgi:CubicO group peptidase (beta-lactamase class C family)